MTEVALEAEEKQKVTDHLVMVHISVQKFSIDFATIYKRNNFSTPKNYLDFIKNYMSFLKDKRNLYDNMVKRLEGGLTTLAKAEGDTKVLSAELEVKN
jgi:dynein heavy chain